MTQFKRYSDGRTAIQRLTGRRWGRPMAVFGERILVKVAVSRAGRRAGLESAFTPAVYVGHHGRSGALMALTEHGAVNARSFKRLPESDRFVVSELEKLKGLPWNLNGSLEAEQLDRERRSSVAGNAVIDVGLVSLPQVDSEDSDGLQCSQGFRDQARPGTSEARLYSFPVVARQREQGRVESCESWHSRPTG